MLNRKEKGKLGEDLAVEFLKQHGLQVVAQNCPLPSRRNRSHRLGMARPWSSLK